MLKACEDHENFIFYDKEKFLEAQRKKIGMVLISWSPALSINSEFHSQPVFRWTAQVPGGEIRKHNCRVQQSHWKRPAQYQEQPQ